MVQTRKCVIVFYIFLINLLVLSIGSYIIYKHFKEAEKQNSGGDAQGLTSDHQEEKPNPLPRQNILLAMSVQMVQYPPGRTSVSISSADDLASSTKFTTRVNSSETIHGFTSNEGLFNSSPPNNRINIPPITESANANHTNSLASDLNTTPHSHSTHQTTDSGGETTSYLSPDSSGTSKNNPSNVNEDFDTNVQEETISKFKNNESSYKVSSETPEPIIGADDVGSQRNKPDSNSYDTLNNPIFESKIAPLVTKTEEEYQEADHSYPISENTTPIDENITDLAYLNFRTDKYLPVIEPSGEIGDQKLETNDRTLPTKSDLKSGGGGDSKIEEHYDTTFSNPETSITINPHPLVSNSIETSDCHTSTIMVSGETSTSKSVASDFETLIDFTKIPQFTSHVYNPPATNGLLATLMETTYAKFTEDSTTQIFDTRGSSLTTKSNIRSSEEIPPTSTKNSTPLAEISATTSYSSSSVENSSVSKVNEQSDQSQSWTVISLSADPHLTNPNSYRVNGSQSRKPDGPPMSSKVPRNSVQTNSNTETTNHSPTESIKDRTQTAQVSSTNGETKETKPEIKSNEPTDDTKESSEESEDDEPTIFDTGDNEEASGPKTENYGEFLGKLGK